ncbi:MAG TPA: hypothetical protein DIS79_02365 [Bacteroidetes bacterium]|nr:hypothetical protein [Bacteroidota bacterium]HRK05192.1 MtnX-like HAD-IB family phosphatase [Chlorobiota bacterium]
MSARLYIDFDGTITRRDSGDEFFRYFTSNEDFTRLHQELLSGAFSVAEYYRRISQRIGRTLQQHEIDAFAETIDVDPGIHRIVDVSQRFDVPLTIVSDGFYNYIAPILRRIGLDGIPVVSNILNLDHEPPVPLFPNASESCSCFCASCKRNIVVSKAAPDDILIYIGDGRSDACAARHSDVVFAKGTLAASCTFDGIPHHSWTNLSEVAIILERRLRMQDVRPRRQAVVARLHAVIAE